MTSAALDSSLVDARSTSARFARYVPHAARLVLGACFFVFGLNGFLSFIPPPAGPQPAGAMAFGMALMQTGYMFPLIKGTEVVAGALLLSNRFVPLALALLAPVIVNIVLFHALLAPEGTVIALATLVLELYLAWVHRRAFAPMLAARAS
jgi:DoxX-like protein